MVKWLTILWRRLTGAGTAGRLARGAFWSSVGAVVSRGFVLAASMVVGRFLGKAAFGMFGVVIGAAMVFQVLAGLGIGITAVRHVAEYRIKDPERAGRIVGLSTLVATAMGLCGAVAVVILAPWLAGEVLGAPELVPALRLSAGIVLLSVINAAQIGAFQGLEAFRPLAWVSALSAVLTALLLVLGAWLAGLMGAVLGQSLGAALGTAIHAAGLRREMSRARLRANYREWQREIRTLVIFSVPAAISATLSMPVQWICQALLVSRAGGFDEVGTFNATNYWRAAVLFLPLLLGSSVVPIATAAVAEGNGVTYRRVLLANQLLTTGLALAIALCVGIAAPWILAGYGPSFLGGSTAMYWAMLSAVIMAASNACGLIVITEGRMWYSALGAAISGAITVFVFAEVVPNTAAGLLASQAAGYAAQLLLFGSLAIKWLARRSEVAAAPTGQANVSPCGERS